MREDVRRLLLFVVTLVLGLVMIGVDLPLVQLLPVLVLIGVVLLFATGALTPEDLGQVGARFRRDRKETSAKPGTGKTEPAKKAEPVPAGKKGGPGLFARMRSSLKELIPERVPRKEGEQKAGLFSRKKKEDPLKGRATEQSAGTAVAARPSAPSPSGGGGKAEDPFLSLSDDELQTDLLDELDEMDAPIPESGEGLSLDMEAVTPPAEPELQGADSILSEHASDLEEFTDLEGIDEIDNELASLEEVDLDEIQLSGLDGLEDADQSVPDLPDTPGGPPDAVSDPTAAAPDVPMFTLPQDSLPDDIFKSEPDMTAFAPGSGGDNDMLSLLASDVKSVKVEADMSILRDLRDVKVSSEDLVTDLESLFQVIGMPAVKGEKKGSGAVKR
ncbi:hypothetical protein [Methanosphaerula subterraneus]|uniref:hypothetical protein n=1 Tax=Methanosphaerula subterraneus TaxID=3350244 RepID=UPI003F865488